jgi:hypothetical protein
MTIDQVIELGRIDYGTTIFAWRYWIYWTLILIFLTIEIFIWKWSFSNYEVKENRGGGLLACAIIFLLLVIVNSIHDSNKEDKLIDKWKEEIAYPFIAQLPEDKKEIIYIKIDPELSHSVQGGFFYTYSNEVQRTPLTVSFKANGVETHTDWYETHMELTNEQQPHIIFKRLEKNLGHGISKGLYDTRVYLPDTYKFTDIK